MVAVGIGLGAGLILGWIIDDLALGAFMGILVELAIEFGGTTVFVTAYGKLGQAGAVQAKLAQMVHVSRQTINAVETENYDPSLDLAFRLGTWFGCPIEGIFEPNSR